jgi:hypothetical protein
MQRMKRPHRLYRRLTVPSPARPGRPLVAARVGGQLLRRRCVRASFCMLQQAARPARARCRSSAGLARRSWILVIGFVFGLRHTREPRGEARGAPVTQQGFVVCGSPAKRCLQRRQS